MSFRNSVFRFEIKTMAPNAGDEIVHFSYSSQWPFWHASNDIDDNNSSVRIREIKENSVQKPTLNRYSLNKYLYNSVSIDRLEEKTKKKNTFVLFISVCLKWTLKCLCRSKHNAIFHALAYLFIKEFIDWWWCGFYQRNFIEFRYLLAYIRMKWLI